MAPIDPMLRKFQMRGKRRRKPPPRYQRGEAGPPIPGLGGYQQKRIEAINDRYIGQSNARHDRSINPRDKYATIPDKRNYRPRRKRRPTLN